MNVATMLGQSRSILHSEIDVVCDTVDFLKIHTYIASLIYETQPQSAFNQLNKMEFRPLEGFVFIVSPFNFSSIISNLNMAPVMMGNTAFWKSATASVLSNYYFMKIFQEAGLQDHAAREQMIKQVASLTLSAGLVRVL